DEDSDSNSASNGSDEDSDGDEDSDSNSASNGSDEDSDRNEDSDSEDSDEDDLKKLQEEFEDLLEDAENELEELEEEEKNRKHEEEETLEDIRLGGVDVSNINKNLSFEIIESNITYNVKYNFNSAYREIKNEIKTTKKLIERILKYRNSTQKKRNQRRGRIHGSKLYKVQLGKEDVFYRKDETNVDLAIILLIDESGSMREYNRYIEARKTAILFKKVLNALNIPHAIWGFQAVYQEHKVEHREYVTFENYKKQKDEILGAISYRDNSRNGFTIRLATNELLKRPEKKKVLIEISDGQPFHNYGYGYYYDEVSMTDTHKSVVEARKKGVYPLGLSIAEKGSHEYMKKIHRDYLCIENVEMLPKQFAKILQKIILA
ncbi:MAG: VWA domain-containing protein, partial [bacterium]